MPALQVLHDLDLARWDHLAFAAGDLFQLGPTCPGEEDDERRHDHEQKQVRETARGVEVSAGAAAHEPGIGALRPSGAAALGGDASAGLDAAAMSRTEPGSRRPPALLRARGPSATTRAPSSTIRRSTSDRSEAR